MPGTARLMSSLLQQKPSCCHPHLLAAVCSASLVLAVDRFIPQ